MTSDPESIRQYQIKGATLLEEYLDQGIDVVYITLGDPSIYCTFTYLKEILEGDGYPVEMISAVPSFCAVAAKLGISLAKKDESLHIIPGNADVASMLSQTGNYVIMKSGRNIETIKGLLSEGKWNVCAVENCGLENEKVYPSLQDIPDDAGYFTVIIARQNGT